MNPLPITLVPNPGLRTKAKKVAQFDDSLRLLADKMIAAMRANNGMGLAAPQLGDNRRVIVLEYAASEPGESSIPLQVLVNPSITASGKKTDWLDEGCLSIPNVELPVERPMEINLVASDLSGKRVKIRAKDLLSRILQHEIDHLDGRLITDRAVPKSAELAGKRILFIGTPEIATPYLSALAATGANIVGVITETDKPAGRKRQLTASPVKELAQKLGLTVYQPVSIKSQDAQEIIKKLQPDVAIVVAYGQIIPPSLLAIPPYGFLNVHYSLLPALRGPSPHQTAVLEGRKETGVTIFRLDKGVDTGPILARQKISIEPIDSADTLLTKLIPLGVLTLLKSLPDNLNNERAVKDQPAEGASQTAKFTKEDGRIDWQKSAEQIDRQIRAMQPWPLAFTEIDGERLIIHQASAVGDQLKLEIVQPAGRQPMSFEDFMRANRADRLTFFRQTGKVKLD